MFLLPMLKIINICKYVTGDYFSFINTVYKFLHVGSVRNLHLGFTWLFLEILNFGRTIFGKRTVCNLQTRIYF